MSAVVRAKPTSPGRRFVVKDKKEGIYSGRPLKSLTLNKHRNKGRNNQGEITCRHRGGGHKKLYRLIDFKRTKDDVIAKVERVEHDPNRSAYIALVVYADGERRYIISPKGLVEGSKISSGENAPIEIGNCLPLANIPLGSIIHNIELQPGKGAQLARSAGACAQLVGRDSKYAIIKLKSGEMRKFDALCRAVIGEVSKSHHSLLSLGKAGAKRWKGIRPTVRGEAMNPVDHRQGGRTRGGRIPSSANGRVIPGKRTRAKAKPSNKFIVKSRHKRK